MKKRAGEILRLNVSIPLWLLLVCGAVAVIASYWVAPTYRDQIKFVTIIVAGAAAIYSAYYVGAGLRLNLDRERQKASFEILSLLNRPEFVKVRHFLETQVEGHEKMSTDELYEKVRSDVHLDEAVTTVLGILEDASIAIQTEYVNENTLHASLLDIVLRTFYSLRGYIEKLRKIKNKPLFFIELEKLCTTWEANRRLCDGKTFPPLGNH